MNNATTELLSRVRRYRNAAGILFGSPYDLAQVCRMLGFRNSCSKGKVYITPTKIRWLEERGLPAPMTADHPGFVSAVQP